MFRLFAGWKPITTVVRTIFWLSGNVTVTNRPIAEDEARAEALIGVTVFDGPVGEPPLSVLQDTPPARANRATENAGNWKVFTGISILPAGSGP